MNFLKEFEIWARKDVVGKIFPREVGLYRRKINDEVELIEYVNESGYVDCYSSVFANWQIVRREFDTIFLDIDEHESGDIRNAYNNLQKVLRLLDEYEVRVYATGRGFHIYVDMPITRLELYGDVVRQWAENIGIVEYVDGRILGDMRRMARLPSTMNAKVGKYCVRVGTDWDIDMIKEAMRIGKHKHSDRIKLNDKLANDLVGIEKELKNDGRRDEEFETYIQRLQYFTRDKKLSELPSCVVEGIKRLFMYGELDHYWRLSMSIFLLKAWGYEETKKLFEMAANDFDERKTEYQLNYIQKRGLHCYSCKKLKLMGICMYDDLKRCPFYVLSNGWLERLVGDAE